MAQQPPLAPDKKRNATARTVLVIVAITCVLAAAVVAYGLTREPPSEASDVCEQALFDQLGDNGLTKMSDLTENASKFQTKVEGSLTYYTAMGAGDRVETWFVCVLRPNSAGSLRVIELTVK